MQDLHFAGPCAERARMVRQEAFAAALPSLLYLLGQAATKLDIDVSRASRVVGDLSDRLKSDPVGKSSSKFFALHTALLRKMELGDVAAVIRIIEGIESSNPADFISKEPKVVSYQQINSDEPNADFVLRDDFETTYNEPFVLKSPSPRDYEKSSQNVNLALSRLEEADGEMYSEICETLDTVMIMQSNTGGAGSCFGTYGLIFFNQETRDFGWTRYYGDLVHEASHNYLYALTHLEPIISDDDGMYMTPLRAEPRPLYMAYHQMFVLGRSILSMRKLQDCSDDVKPEKTHRSYTQRELTDEYAEAYEIIESNASKVTEFGLNLSKSLKSLVDA